MYMFCLNQELFPVPEPDNIAARFRNRLPGSRIGCPVPEPDKVLDWDRTYIFGISKLNGSWKYTQT